MNKKLFIAVGILIVVVIFGGYLFFQGGENQTQQESDIKDPSQKMPVPGFESVPETQVISDEEIMSDEEELDLSDGGVVSATTTREINMVSGNLFFTPTNLTLVENQPVRITFQNTGTHTFTINELGVNFTISGSSGVAEFTPSTSGTFEYYCAVPGHRQGGMFGTLTVE